ncbi:MAG: hypothetical protein ABI599_12835 [Flavobacteriales bacterium]
MRNSKSTALFFLLFGVAAVPHAARAQQNELRIIHLWAEAPVSAEQEKRGAEQLAFLDPDSRFSIQPDRQHLKTGWHSQVDAASVGSALALAGIIATIIETEPFPAGDVRDASSVPDVFPAFVDTGSPEQDNQNYNAAKAAWIAAHPAEYQQLLSPPTEE